MIWRALLAAGLIASPASAEDLFAEGTVLCSNFDEKTHSCRTMTTVTALKDGVRHAKSRRFVAMPEKNLLLETEGVAKVEGAQVCHIGPTADPKVSPAQHTYSAAILAAYVQRRDKRLERGVCHSYRRCGSGWDVYISYDDEPGASLVSFTTAFAPDDVERLDLQVRERKFGVKEQTYSECSPIG